MDEQKVLNEGIERVKMWGITKREFFQVDLRDAIRQEDRRTQQEERIKEEERMKEEQERIKKEEEEEKRKTQQEEESQSLFEIEERMAESEYHKRQYANFANLYKSFTDKKP